MLPRLPGEHEPVDRAVVTGNGFGGDLVALLVGPVDEPVDLGAVFPVSARPGYAEA